MSFSAAPVIDRTNLENLKIKAGQMIKFDCNVTGEPTPAKTWYINKEKQENNKNGVKIDEEPNRIKLVISNCTRAHNGQYVIKASNSAGKDEVKIDVTVMGTKYIFVYARRYFLFLRNPVCGSKRH